MINYDELNKKYPLPDGLTFCECNKKDGSLSVRDAEPREDGWRWHHAWYYPNGDGANKNYKKGEVWMQERDEDEKKIAEAESVDQAAAFMSARLILLGIEE